MTWTIVIYLTRPPKPPGRHADSIALLGCALVALAAALVFAVGVTTIAGWTR